MTSSFPTGATDCSRSGRASSEDGLGKAGRDEGMGCPGRTSLSAPTFDVLTSDNAPASLLHPLSTDGRDARAFDEFDIERSVRQFEIAADRTRTRWTTWLAN